MQHWADRIDALHGEEREAGRSKLKVVASSTNARLHPVAAPNRQIT